MSQELISFQFVVRQLYFFDPIDKWYNTSGLQRLSSLRLPGYVQRLAERMFEHFFELSFFFSRNGVFVAEASKLYSDRAIARTVQVEE
jgi:hypothetical protein